MSKDPHDNNLAQDEEFLDEGGNWSEDNSVNVPQAERATPVPRVGSKRKAIEEYWEQKRLRDRLQDYLTEES